MNLYRVKCVHVHNRHLIQEFSSQQTSLLYTETLKLPIAVQRDVTTVWSNMRVVTWYSRTKGWRRGWCQTMVSKLRND